MKILLPAVVAVMVVLSGCSAEPQPIDPAPEPVPSSAQATSAAPTSARPPSPASTSAEPAPTPSGTPATGSDDETALREAVQGYSDTFLTGDIRGYDYFSERCQARRTKEEFGEILAMAKSTYGAALPIRTFEAEIESTMARVTYTYDLPAINQDREPWVKEDGQWRQDDC